MREQGDRGVRDIRCPSCGTEYLGRPGAPCPGCGRGGHSVIKSDDEMTKKVIDDNDLVKGTR